MRFGLSQTLLALGLSLASVSAQAKILVLQFSDSHSDYAQLPDFVRSVSQVSQEFKQAHPDGTVILFGNGDIAGVSAWAESDHGRLSYRVFSLLDAHYTVGLSLGNHEGFDVKSGKPNQVFVDQNRELLSGAPGQFVLAANIVPTELGRSLFRPYKDVPLANGKTLRIVGMTVQNFFRESSYNFRDGPQLFLNEQPTLLEEGKRQLLAAAKAGITTVIFECHEMTEIVRIFARELLQWKQTRPELTHLSVPFFGAGHKHKVTDEREQGSAIVEAGSHYAFSAITINDHNEPESVVHWSHEAQMQTRGFTALRDSERQLIAEADAIVSTIRIQDQRVISHHTPQLPLEFEARKELTGSLLSTSFAEWARSHPQALMSAPATSGVIAFVNTLSFWDAPALFEGGPLTQGVIKRLIPFNGHPVARVMTGRDVQKVFTALRKFGQESASPFVTPAMDRGWSELPDGSLLETLSHTPLQPDAHYLLMTDHWLGGNGYKIPEIETAYARALWSSALPDLPPLFRKIAEDYLPAQLDSCAQALTRKP